MLNIPFPHSLVFHAQEKQKSPIIKLAKLASFFFFFYLVVILKRHEEQEILFSGPIKK